MQTTIFNHHTYGGYYRRWTAQEDTPDKEA